MKIKNLIAISLISAASFVGGAWVYGKYTGHENIISSATSPYSSLYRTAKYDENAASAPMVNFETAASKASPAVVHVKVLKRGMQRAYGFGFDGMSYDQGNDGDMPAQQVGSGSGVIISPKGYIVTNNHVVESADELLVTLNDKKDYKATVVGTDPSTDLAVVKIDADNLPYLNFSNSDDVRIGQWILAIGYPLNLETTVTSGIVSAKARNIGINNRNSETPIESFIQTDAAVNPGNSGGALVNIQGDLIGINSAIASPTGSYAGYSYAIPSNLVKRVVGDIVKYGSAKRPYLGIMYGSDQMTDADRKKNNIPDGDGIYVMEVANGSAAEKAGIQKGDFITKINGHTIVSGTEMVEKISSLHPGDTIDISYTHNGTEQTANVELQASAGDYQQQQKQLNR